MQSNMEHNDMDEKFRDLIRNDDSDLNEQERSSKEAIWERIDSPQKERIIFPFWQIAASVLLLLLGGAAWLFTNKINQQNQHFAQIEKELLETKNSLQTVQQELVLLEAKNVRAENNNTCLLYTSPSPRDATLSRMPSSA